MRAALVGGALALLFAAASPRAQGVPDVLVWDLGVGGLGNDDILLMGRANGIAGYAFATQSCNGGTAPLDWYDAGGDNRHPVIAQNLYRLKDGRFEQLGQSWLKHGFCAVNEGEAGCGPCQSTPCDTLGVGCADTYTASLNDGRGGRSKRFVDAASGVHVTTSVLPVGDGRIRGRLQVAIPDIAPGQNPGAQFFIEGHYVAADDHAAGQAANNVSWRPIEVLAVGNLRGAGPTRREEPALYAWAESDPTVEVRRIDHVERGFLTYLFLGCKVTRLGPEAWSYEYALHNLNSSQGVRAFRLPAPPVAELTDLGFHDVAYHSGDPYDGTDWAVERREDFVRWTTDDHATCPEANALRWGTLYNFRLVANTPPERGPLTLELFAPGALDRLTVAGVPHPGKQGLARKAPRAAGAPR